MQLLLSVMCARCFCVLCFVLYFAVALPTNRSDERISCKYIKRCFESPVDRSDEFGIKACFGDSLADDCLSTATPPFYSCLCKCGQCTTFHENCATVCAISTTSTSTTSTSTSAIKPVIPT